MSRTDSARGAGQLEEARAVVLPMLAQQPASLQLPGTPGFGGDSPSDGGLGRALSAPVSYLSAEVSYSPA